MPDLEHSSPDGSEQEARRQDQRRSLADQQAGANNCDDKQVALEAADRVFERVERKVAEGLKPGSDPLEAVVEIGEEMDSERAAEVRDAAGIRSRVDEKAFDKST